IIVYLSALSLPRPPGHSTSIGSIVKVGGRTAGIGSLGKKRRDSLHPRHRNLCPRNDAVIDNVLVRYRRATGQCTYCASGNADTSKRSHVRGVGEVPATGILQ